MKYYAVIDTNVLVSSMLKNSTPPNRIVWESVRGDIIPIVNKEILHEYEEVLRRKKFGFSEKIVRAMITDITNRAIFVDAIPLEEVLPDSKDAVFYEVVMEGRKTNAAYLVTGNLKHFPKRPFIVSPREMLEIMERAESESKTE